MSGSCARSDSPTYFFLSRYAPLFVHPPKLNQLIILEGRIINPESDFEYLDKKLNAGSLTHRHHSQLSRESFKFINRKATVEVMKSRKLEWSFLFDRATFDLAKEQSFKLRKFAKIR